MKRVKENSFSSEILKFMIYHRRIFCVLNIINIDFKKTFLLLNHFLSPRSYHTFGTLMKPTPYKRRIMKQLNIESIILVYFPLSKKENGQVRFSRSELGQLAFLELHSQLG